MKKSNMDGLARFSNAIKNLGEDPMLKPGEHEIDIKDLLTDAFVSKHTRFSSFEEMMSAYGFTPTSTEEFVSIPEAAFDSFISSCSNFQGWEQMREAAVLDYSNELLKKHLQT